MKIFEYFRIFHMRLILLTFLMCTLQISPLRAQMNEVYAAIKNNNTHLKTLYQEFEMNSYQVKIGINPSNPIVNIDYMIGRPVEGGNQMDFSIDQPFDFPTVYGDKKTLAKEILEKSNRKIKHQIQEILLEASLLTIQIIHQNKLIKEIDLRVQKLLICFPIIKISLIKAMLQL